MDIVWIDGKFYERENAKISVFDHGLLYGDGVFDSFRIYNGLAFRMQDHLVRLWQSANDIGLKIPISQSELTDIVKQTYRNSGLVNAFVRLLITRGVGEMGVDPDTCKPSIIIMVVEREIVRTPIRATITKGSINPRTKTLNYLEHVMSRKGAQDHGYDEAIMYEEYYHITEATTSNIFMVQFGSIFTTPLLNNILEGITRKVIMEHFSVREKVIHPFELMRADEVFLTGTGDEIVPVIEINDKRIGTGLVGPVTQQVMEKFDKLKLEGEIVDDFRY